MKTSLAMNLLVIRHDYILTECKSNIEKETNIIFMNNIYKTKVSFNNKIIKKHILRVPWYINNWNILGAECLTFVDITLEEQCHNYQFSSGKLKQLFEIEKFV